MSIQNTQNLSINGTSLAETEESRLSTDEILTILANSRRRHAIQIMMEHERIDFGELVDRVAELEYGLDIDEISSDERHTIYVSLQQTHAQKLEENGVITRERDTGTVGLGENADQFVDWIAKINGEDSIGDKLKRSISALC